MNLIQKLIKYLGKLSEITSPQGNSNRHLKILQTEIRDYFVLNLYGI